MKHTLTILLAGFLIFRGIDTYAQVKIGNNPNTINANSLLELESTNKGFLPPRVALNSISSVSPLTGTVPAGMLVYSTGGTLTDGCYQWNGSRWKQLSTGTENIYTKSADATLLKNETFILASNDITLTLPAVTSSDNGLTIHVKHVGSHTDLVSVIGNSGATIDADSSYNIHRWEDVTFVADGGNWIVRNRETKPLHLLDVNARSSWTSIQEVVEYLNAHMDGPTVVRLGSETYDISSTQVIDLPYSLTFQGLSYGTTTIGAASGLAGQPMFRCLSDCYFKMLQFDATTLTNYGTLAGEDAIRLLGSGSYNEIKDCNFERFYNAILDSTDAELWLFETDISNAKHAGVLIHSGVSNVTVKVAETDFIGCKYGINMEKGSSATIQLASGGYYNANATDTAVYYNASGFSSYSSISIAGNSWNNVGKFIEGFDFSRSDGRDANVLLESNAGMGDKRPNCNINVLNNTTTTTTLSTTNSWYKANWGSNTSSTTCKWTIVNNKITFQPTNKKNGYFIISGNLSCNNANRTISIGIVKNSSSGTRYGETTLRTGSSTTPTQFSTVVYLSDIAPGDYFEIYCSTTNGGDIITIQDLLWLTQTQ